MIANKISRNGIVIFFVLVALLPVWNNIQAQQRIYTTSNAHAHNDYLHPHPFFSAWQAGFGSMEADIFLRNNSLCVSHDTAGIDPNKTLQSLYLNPLKLVIRKNSNHVYSDSNKKLILLIDLKTEGVSTLDALVKVLESYSDLTSCADLKLVITGNQPPPAQWNQYPSWIYFDGNLKKNYDAEALKKIVLFSGDFRKFSSWKGSGVQIQSEKDSLIVAIKKAHDLQKPVRFWAAPDTVEAWKELMMLDADYINTDKIKQLSGFLKRK